MLSSFIFLYVAVNHTNLAQKLSFIRKHKIEDIVSRWLSHFASSTVVLYQLDKLLICMQNSYAIKKI